MRVLHINSYCANDVFYKNLFEGLGLLGITNKIYVPVPEGRTTLKADLGKAAFVAPVFKKHERIFFYLKHKKILRSILKTYDFSKIDLIHSHSLFSNGYIAYMLNKMYGIPYITALRNTDVNMFFKYMIPLRNLGVNILKNAEKVIFLSPKYKEYSLCSYLNPKDYAKIMKKSEVIPNGVDNYWLSNIYLDKKEIYSNNINLLFVGKISKQKNIPIIINAVEILINRGINTSLWVVGPIVCKGVFNKIKENPNVIYKGVLTKKELISIYRQADIFVMPSKAETFGLVYVEAMSQGLPVIYTKNQGFDGQVEDGEAGYAVNCNNPYEIVDSIMKIIKNYAVISENCKECVAKFDWNIICKKYTKIYNEIKGL